MGRQKTSRIESKVSLGELISFEDASEEWRFQKLSKEIREIFPMIPSMVRQAVNEQMEALTPQQREAIRRSLEAERV